jgi:hypothetical protein
MATAALDPQTTRNKSALSAAYLRAFQLDRELEDTDPDDPEAQFAYAALYGARARALECGIHSLDHVALAALLCLESISDVIDNDFVDHDGEKVITVEDVQNGLRLTKKALKGIWNYASREAEMPSESWDPVLKFLGADRI